MEILRYLPFFIPVIIIIGLEARQALIILFMSKQTLST